MIVNIRGTSGSGKSTIVRKIMKLYKTTTPVAKPGRKKPLYYILDAGGKHLPGRGEGGPTLKRLVVLGHYDNPCGGGDTVSGYGRDFMFDWVREHNTLGHDILFEGLMIGGERTRTIRLWEENLPIVVVNLTTKIEVCLAGVQKRRDERGDTRPLNPKNTVAKMREVDRACEVCEAAGVHVHQLYRAKALAKTKELLGWS